MANFSSKSHLGSAKSYKKEVDNYNSLKNLGKMNIVQSIVSQRTRDGGSGSKKLTPDITRSTKNSNIKLRPRLNLAN